MALRNDVLNFLQRYKEQIAVDQLHLVPRRKNREDIARLGLTYSDVRNIVLSLTPEDYVQGPEADHDGSQGEIWAFGVNIEGAWIYIKLKLEPFSSEDEEEVMKAKCLSFHEAQYRLTFPLARRTRK